MLLILKYISGSWKMLKGTLGKERKKKKTLGVDGLLSPCTHRSPPLGNEYFLMASLENIL